MSDWDDLFGDNMDVEEDDLGGQPGTSLRPPSAMSINGTSDSPQPAPATPSPPATKHTSLRPVTPRCQWTLMDKALADLSTRPDSNASLYFNQIARYDRETFTGKQTWATTKASGPLPALFVDQVFAAASPVIVNVSGGSGDQVTEEGLEEDEQTPITRENQGKYMPVPLVLRGETGKLYMWARGMDQPPSSHSGHVHIWHNVHAINVSDDVVGMCQLRVTMTDLLPSKLKI
ncbi:uncharacterized protein MELLADRAFT_102066 [Melampsora larici-populina 98AG31]|uniref:Uncharacterized protein n=1 Tax=Melampsora larici-populina (strain 98AG31 / pathotype 3-4-7) TaxID=747676 RepID=F4R5W5_MELLP|nr:uncharacterized protein MELLADRAFT_102066 [Melampsora larici-populina 98AG31]EGG12110.1 hypothetical protein MELLADRAFT_102066 [Melampsora larici-populina 98AG31]